MTRIEDIRKMSTEDIKNEIASLKKELFNLRFKQATGQLQNTADISKNKKTIARMYTVLTERENQE